MASVELGLQGSHAARYGASEFLKDRHPDLSAPFPADVIPEEIAVAYGRRHVPKLVDVISLPDDQLPDEERARCLRYLLHLLANQETKSEAVTCGASDSLVHLLESKDPYVRELTCNTISSLAQLLTARAAIVQAQGIPALTLLLKDKDPSARAAAAQSLEAVSSGPEGAAAVLACDSQVQAREVDLLEDSESTHSARMAAVLTLANCTSTDGGIYQALDAHVPRTLLRLCTEGLALDTAEEEARKAERKKAGKSPKSRGTTPKSRTGLEKEGGDLEGRAAGTPNSDHFEDEEEREFSDEEAARAELHAACLRCLRNLAHHPYGKVQVLEEGGIPVFAKFLVTDDQVLQQLGAGCLMALTVEEDAKLPTAEACAEVLVDMLHHPNPDVAENALATLQNSCEHPAAREIVENLLDDEDMEFVFCY
mmetsp:Transcript_33997/g.47101  ORF Transcript_33997/g.47101 Transcript_33997/m.47101 type:complete len:424 (+) Transcript_33997:164-1435(+)|eukprot:CAMPEP_0196590270 /NCGR_PEP_ID=MMETSP1081-20130531/66158_1 /TAXON_ID=36882 /ORGANISM="Pyramimonas amylifera, Strain CCMP720" /LENGTH=423 /DNA_ID=CAMNT_0041913333 /DNA_START=162 /DNA_END=1433 /DNA_ORIENTATION=-